MNKLTMLLVVLSSLLSACATPQAPAHPYGEQRSIGGALCPPSQAIKGLC